MFFASALVAWLPFVCLFAPFNMTVQEGDAWYVPLTTLIYLRACWFYSPTVAIVGPAWLVAAALVQSILVMLALRLCADVMTRLVMTGAARVARILPDLRVGLVHLRAHLAAFDTRSAFFVERKRAA